MQKNIFKFKLKKIKIFFDTLKIHFVLIFSKKLKNFNSVFI